MLLQRNPSLIIVRLTGFRRTGPYSKMAGHDLNYIALSGVLSESQRCCFGCLCTSALPASARGLTFLVDRSTRTQGRQALLPCKYPRCAPSSVTLVAGADRARRAADFAGGGMMAVVGVLMTLIERGRTGKGQVVEVDMVRLS